MPGHERGEIAVDDLHAETAYDKWDAYAPSKLANLLVAYELDRRLQAADASVTSGVCHPGWAATGRQRHGPKRAGSTLGLWLTMAANPLVRPAGGRGALPRLYAARAPAIDDGEYLGPGGFLHLRGALEEPCSSARSYDAETARRLWQVSEEPTDVTFDLPTHAPGASIPREA